jgi:hypothetical protein
MVDDVEARTPAGDGMPRSVGRHGPYHRVIERRNAYKEFTRRVIALHQVVLTRTGQMPMCACGSVARMCPVLNAAHDLLGHPVPWDS